MRTQADPPALLAEAPEYCVEVELMDTRTGLTTRARGCEPDPGWEPVEVPIGDPDSRLLGLPNCEVPPAGLEEPWCGINRAYFFDKCPSALAATYPVSPLCTAYGQACGVSPEELEERWCEINRADFYDECGAPFAATDPVDPLCTEYRQACVGDSNWPPPPDDGCACRLAAPPGRDGAGSRAGLLALLALVALGRGRRHARGASAWSLALPWRHR